jgi:transposase-like protein
MKKECFKRVFVSFKECWKEFLAGCRPYLVVDTTALNGRFRGQLVATCAIDAHNWLFPVTYGVLKTESAESWTWFLQNLRHIIGFPDGLAIHTDACKGLEIAVEDVFPGAEHRECMRHLATHFKLQGFKGQLFDDKFMACIIDL